MDENKLRHLLQTILVGGSLGVAANSTLNLHSSIKELLGDERDINDNVLLVKENDKEKAKTASTKKGEERIGSVDGSGLDFALGLLGLLGGGAGGYFLSDKLWDSHKLNKEKQEQKASKTEYYTKLKELDKLRNKQANENGIVPMPSGMKFSPADRALGLTLAISVLAALGTGKLTNQILEETYPSPDKDRRKKQDFEPQRVEYIKSGSVEQDIINFENFVTIHLENIKEANESGFLPSIEMIMGGNKDKLLSKAASTNIFDAMDWAHTQERPDYREADLQTKQASINCFCSNSLFRDNLIKVAAADFADQYPLFVLAGKNLDSNFAQNLINSNVIETRKKAFSKLASELIEKVGEDKLIEKLNLDNLIDVKVASDNISVAHKEVSKSTLNNLDVKDFDVDQILKN